VNVRKFSITAFTRKKQFINNCSSLSFVLVGLSENPVTRTLIVQVEYWSPVGKLILAYTTLSKIEIIEFWPIKKLNKTSALLLFIYSDFSDLRFLMIGCNCYEIFEIWQYCMQLYVAMVSQVRRRTRLAIAADIVPDFRPDKNSWKNFVYHSIQRKFELSWKDVAAVGEDKHPNASLMPAKVKVKVKVKVLCYWWIAFDDWLLTV